MSAAARVEWGGVRGCTLMAAVAVGHSAGPPGVRLPLPAALGRVLRSVDRTIASLLWAAVEVAFRTAQAFQQPLCGTHLQGAVVCSCAGPPVVGGGGG